MPLELFKQIMKQGVIDHLFISFHFRMNQIITEWKQETNNSEWESVVWGFATFD